MSNIDLLWNEQQAAEAAAEGWLLAYVVDAGKPVSTARLDIFETNSPRFADRSQAIKYVISMAHNRSKLHIAALSACSASRMKAATASTGKKK